MLKPWLYICAATSASFIFGASAAMADWQYTRWGMSPAEVVAASAGAAQLQRNEGADIRDTKALAAGSYSAGSIKFNVSYLFDGEERLSMVSLTPQNPAEECEALIGLAKKYYGPPVSQSRPKLDLMFMEWQDGAHQNGISFYYSIPQNCSLTYYQRAAANAAGGL